MQILERLSRRRLSEQIRKNRPPDDSSQRQGNLSHRLSLTDIRSWHRHYKPDLVQSGEHIRRYGLSKWADLVPILLVLELVGCLTYLGTLIIETWVSAIIVAQP